MYVGHVVIPFPFSLGPLDDAQAGLREDSNYKGQLKMGWGPK